MRRLRHGFAHYVFPMLLPFIPHIAYLLEGRRTGPFWRGGSCNRHDAWHGVEARVTSLRHLLLHRLSGSLPNSLAKGWAMIKGSLPPALLRAGINLLIFPSPDYLARSLCQACATIPLTLRPCLCPALVHNRQQVSACYTRLLVTHAIILHLRVAGCCLKDLPMLMADLRQHDIIIRRK